MKKTVDCDSFFWKRGYMNIEIVTQIAIAIGIVIGFRILSAGIASLIIKILTSKNKEKKDVKKNPLYQTALYNYSDNVTSHSTSEDYTIAGLEEIPAIIRDDDEQTNKEIALIENIQREDLNPYEKAAFIFCNKKRNSIKVLCYDKNGFILAKKKLLDTEKMKFQWPRNSSEMKNITREQLRWLLSGLKINPEKCFKEIELTDKKIAV